MRRNRSRELIAEFENGFAKEWFMAIGEFYRNELDIRLTERKSDKVSYQVWTQGPYISFSSGHVFYNTKSVYEKIWSEAIREIEVACQITSAAPCKLDEKGIFLDGKVKFDLFRKDENQNGLVLSQKLETTQTEFVQFLKTGKLPTETTR